MRLHPALHSKARMDAHSESTAHRFHPRLPHEPRYESNCSIAPSASPQALRDRAAGEDLFPARTGTRAHQALQRPLLTPVCNPDATLSPAQNRLVCIPRPSRVLDCCITLGVSGCPCQGAPKARRMASAAAQQPSMSAAPMIPGQNMGHPCTLSAQAPHLHVAGMTGTASYPCSNVLSARVWSPAGHSSTSSTHQPRHWPRQPSQADPKHTPPFGSCHFENWLHPAAPLSSHGALLDKFSGSGGQPRAICQLL